MEHIKELNPKVIAKLVKSTDAQKVISHLRYLIGRLDRNSDIPDDWTNEQRGAEVLARKRAVQQLRKVTQPFDDFLPEEEKESTKEGSLYLSHEVE